MSLVIRHVNGTEGQVELSGAKAVVAMFYKWHVERRGESDEWTLRASLSYQKDAFLKQSRWGKRIKLKALGSEYEATPIEGVEWTITDDNRLIIEGVKLCRVDPPKPK